MIFLPFSTFQSFDSIPFIFQKKKTKYDSHCPRPESTIYFYDCVDFHVLWVSNLLCAENLILNFMIDINIMMVMMMGELTNVFL